MIRIAVDAMGGDHAPEEVVKGAVQVARETDLELILVGKPQDVVRELARYDTDGLPITIEPAEEVIAMDEDPVAGVRQKRRASIVVAAQVVKEGRADAVATAGHSGAAYMAALLTWGTIEGVRRPTVGCPYFALQEQTFIFDAGPSVNSKPEYLLQYAQLGRVYLERIVGVRNPTVALLGFGVEDNKGDRLLREAFPLLANSDLNFIGFVEGMDIAAGRANIVVCDGLVGNVAVKVSEGLSELLLGLLEHEVGIRLGPEALNSGFGEALACVRERANYELIGGMPVLGVNGICVIGHGRSRAPAVKNTILRAKHCVELDLVETIRDGWRELAPDD